MPSYIGNLTRDPDLRFSAKGTAFCRFGLAVTPYVPGQGQGETVFYDVTAFGTLAQNVAESHRKGDRVIIDGRLEEPHVGSDGKTYQGIIADGLGAEERFNTVQVVRDKRVTVPAGASSAEIAYAAGEEEF